jgi:hypothetical protein
MAAPALYQCTEADDGDGTNPGPASAARVPPADAVADAAVDGGGAGGRSDDLCPERRRTGGGSQPPGTWPSRPTSPRPASDRHSVRCPRHFL